MHGFDRGDVTVFDTALPAYEALSGPDAQELVGAAYASIGLTVEDLAVRQVQYEPGIALSVRYAATLRSPLTGQWWVEPVTAAVDAHGAVPGALVVSDGHREVGVFRWPHDPRLPGLVRAADSTAQPQWWEPCGDDLTIDVVGYRPGRRAVLHGSGSDGDVFVKVLTPRKAARSARRLDTLRRHGVPVPRVLMRDLEAGVLVLEGLPGATLRQRLTEQAPAPSPDELLALLDLLPSSWADGAREVPAPSTHAARHAAVIAQVLPAARPALDRILAAVTSDIPEPAVAVHGDFHDDQLLVDERGEIVGLLDVDGAGSGHRADDLGTMLAHQLTMEQIAPTQARSAYIDRMRQSFAHSVGERSLRVQTAAALVGLATGPYRAQELQWERATLQRLDAALELVEAM
jgi:aminoglycoside phosphotransferase (APT) family kinase protein